MKSYTHNCGCKISQTINEGGILPVNDKERYEFVFVFCDFHNELCEKVYNTQLKVHHIFNLMHCFKMMLFQERSYSCINQNHIECQDSGCQCICMHPWRVNTEGVKF